MPPKKKGATKALKEEPIQDANTALPVATLPIKKIWKQLFPVMFYRDIKKSQYVRSRLWKIFSLHLRPSEDSPYQNYRPSSAKVYPTRSFLIRQSIGTGLKTLKFLRRARFELQSTPKILLKFGRCLGRVEQFYFSVGDYKYKFKRLFKKCLNPKLKSLTYLFTGYYQNCPPCNPNYMSNALAGFCELKTLDIKLAHVAEGGSRRMRNLNQLKELRLKANAFELFTAEDLALMENLKELEILSHHILQYSKILTKIDKMQNLQKVKLLDYLSYDSVRGLTKEDLSFLGSFHRLPNVSLDLKFQIQNTKDCYFYLEKLESVKELELQFPSQLRKKHCESINEALGNLTQVQTLGLRIGNGAYELASIGTTLSKFKTLKKLQLDMDIGPENKHMYKNITLPQLEELKVSCPLSKSYHDEGELFGQFLARHSGIRKLDLRINTIIPQSLKAILDGIQGHKKLEEFFFEFGVGQGFNRDEGLEGFQALLPKLISLRVFHFKTDPKIVQPEELVALMDGINKVKMLKELSFSVNLSKVDKAVFGKFVEFVREKKRSLEKLEISHKNYKKDTKELDQILGLIACPEMKSFTE